MGAAGRLRYIETPLPHGLSYSLRVAVYDWFERHLKQTARTISEEPPTAPESEQTLWCGPTGNTARDFGARTPYQMVRAAAESVRTPEQLPDLRQVLGMETASAPARLEVRGRTRYADCDVEAVEVNTAANVWAPAWLFVPRRPWTRLLLAIEPSGRNLRWHEDDLYAQIAGAGIAVCAADVRGVGDLDPQYGPGAAGYVQQHHKEENYAWASLILGRSLLGQRTTDILRVAQALAAEYPRALLTVAARDKMTVPRSVRSGARTAHRQAVPRRASGFVARTSGGRIVLSPVRRLRPRRAGGNRPTADRALPGAASRHRSGRRGCFGRSGAACAGSVRELPREAGLGPGDALRVLRSLLAARSAGQIA